MYSAESAARWPRGSGAWVSIDICGAEVESFEHCTSIGGLGNYPLRVVEVDSAYMFLEVLNLITMSKRGPCR
jgi:hypothetical protein